jgi:hypothetical protein
MSVKRVAGLFVSCLLLAALTKAQESAPELWYWHHCFLASDDALASSKALVDRAAKAGYNGVALWDSGFSFLSQDFFPIANEDRMKELMKYVVSKHMKVMALAAPFGYSNDALETDPNWAESERIAGAQFRVDPSGRRLDLINSFPGLRNAGFEDGKNGWFDTGDAGMSVSTTVSHSGKNSGVIVDAPANARFRETVTLNPWRQYHLRLFYKAQRFRGAPMLEVLDASDYSKHRLVAYLSNSANHDWMEADYAFNSGDTTRADLYFGIWGGSSGMLWFDDIQLEETALVYVTRRSGTPLKVYDPEHPNSLYREREDYDYITDPRMTSTRTPFTDSYHDPAPVKLPRKTRLRPGQTVAMDFYAAFPIPSAYGMNMCMTDPGVLKWLARNARGLKRIAPATAAVLLGYDEIREMNSCASCRAKHMTAGQLLAWSVGQSLATYRSAMPEAQFYVWNDMFDPYHNAVNNYYYVEGDLAGSWKGVPANVAVLNWNLGRLKQSLTWFSGLDSRQPTTHRQVIAGYYDSGNGAAAAREELAAAHGIPSVDGLMYTTWNNDYSQLESFANAVRQNWTAYAASVPNDKKKAGIGALWLAAAGCFPLLTGILIFVKRRFSQPSS